MKMLLKFVIGSKSVHGRLADATSCYYQERTPYPDAILYSPTCEYAAGLELWCVWLAVDINGEPSLQAELIYQ